MSAVSPLEWLAERLRLGDGPCLTRADAKLWAQAQTLADLGELTAQWLEGRIESQPGYYGPVDVDEDIAPGLTATLVALNRAGFLTNSSQAGFDGTEYDGAQWQQLAAVEGFADPHAAAWLRDAFAGTRFQIITWPCRTGWSRARPGVCVTWRDGRPCTGFGRQLGEAVIACELYDGCSNAAISALCGAMQVTIYDPQPGANELWPVLRAAAKMRMVRP